MDGTEIRATASDTPEYWPDANLVAEALAVITTLQFSSLESDSR